MRLNTRASTEVLAVLAKVVKTLIDEISLPLSTQKVLLDKELPSGKPKPSLAQNVQDDLKNARERVSELQGNHLDHLNRGLEALKTLTQTRDTAEKKAAESIAQIVSVRKVIQEKIDEIKIALEDPNKKAAELSALARGVFELGIATPLRQLLDHSKRPNLPPDIKEQLDSALQSVQPLRKELLDNLGKLGELITKRRQEEMAITFQNAIGKSQIKNALAVSTDVVNLNKTHIQEAESKIKEALGNINLEASELKDVAEEINHTRETAASELQAQKELLEKLLNAVEKLRDFDTAELSKLKTAIQEVETLQTTLPSLEDGQKKLTALAEQREAAEKEATESEKIIAEIQQNIEAKVTTNKELKVSEMTEADLAKEIKTTGEFEKTITERLRVPQEHRDRADLLPYIKERLVTALIPVATAQEDLKNQLISLNKAHLARANKDDEMLKSISDFEHGIEEFEKDIGVQVKTIANAQQDPNQPKKQLEELRDNAQKPAEEKIATLEQQLTALEEKALKGISVAAQGALKLAEQKMLASIEKQRKALTAELENLKIAIQKWEEEDNKIKGLANTTKVELKQFDETTKLEIGNAQNLPAQKLDELVIKIQDSEKKISDLQKQRKEFEGTRKIEARAADMRQLIEEVDGLEQKALLEMHNEQIRLAELAKTIRLKDKDVKAEIEKHLSAIKLFIEKNIEPKIQEIKDTLKSGIKNVIELNKLAGEIKALGETVNKNFNDQLEGLRKLLVPLNLDAGVRTSVEAAIENVKNMQTEQLKALDSGEKDLRELAKAQGIEDQRVMDLIAANNKVVDPI
ncbi:hypothetical protein GAMM_40307 [Gammaproteobacteria bacterium]